MLVEYCHACAAGVANHDDTCPVCGQQWLSFEAHWAYQLVESEKAIVKQFNRKQQLLIVVCIVIMPLLSAFVSIPSVAIYGVVFGPPFNDIEIRVWLLWFMVFQGAFWIYVVIRKGELTENIVKNHEKWKTHKEYDARRIASKSPLSKSGISWD